jgi:hypothetical protein
MKNNFFLIYPKRIGNVDVISADVMLISDAFLGLRFLTVMRN